MPPQYLSRSRQKLPSEPPPSRRGVPPVLLGLVLVLPLLLLFPRRLGGVLSGRLAGPHEGGAV